MKRKIYTGAALTALLVGLGVASYKLDKQSVVQAATTQAPKFEVDPMWPKPLPNHWIMGNVIGTSVDSNDHIWIIHRQGSLEAMEDYAVADPPGAKRQRGKVESECCVPAPPVLEFDEAGNLIGHWGGLNRQSGRLCMAGFEPRNHGRFQRQCLDWRQWPRKSSGSCASGGSWPWPWSSGSHSG